MTFSRSLTSGIWPIDQNENEIAPKDAAAYGGQNLVLAVFNVTILHKVIR
jgi:hypothetical protein